MDLNSFFRSSCDDEDEDDNDKDNDRYIYGALDMYQALN